MKNKIIWLIILLLIPAILFGSLPVYIDCNRFLTNEQNTKFEITYKIFHKDLAFKMFNKMLTSQIEVDFTINNSEGTELYQKDFTKRITSEDNLKFSQEEGFFIDKINAVLRPGTYQFKLALMDDVSGKKIIWEKQLNTLSQNNFGLSDIEISSFSRPAAKNKLSNFRHKSRSFLVNPNRTFINEEENNFVYYFEIYVFELIPDETKIKVEVVNESDSTLFIQEEEKLITNKITSFWKKINIEAWQVGTYRLKVAASNPELLDGKKITNQKSFFIKEKTKIDLETEYNIAQYFLSNKQKKVYETMSYNGKKKLLESFWAANDPNPKTEKNELKNLIEQRIEYAKQHYSTLTKGWENDRGRIYVLYGKPDERIERGFDYQAKPFIIWKYISGGMKRVYLFVDFTGQGNYRLVWCKNDENEVKDPQWRSYLGPYFDDQLLE